MELVVRAYDHQALDRAERMPVDRLWSYLESGGLRDAAKVREGLTAPLDVFARETIAARMEALKQEGYGARSVFDLRGGAPPGLAALHASQWPAIGEEEAVELREDLVRYFTYGLWRATEAVVARALAMLTGSSDTAFLIGGDQSTARLQAVLDNVQDDPSFLAAYGSAIREALSRIGARADDNAVTQEMTRFGQLFSPLSRLVRDARSADLRVIVYQDVPGGEGLARFLRTDLPRHIDGTAVAGHDAATANQGLEHRNGHQA